MIANALHGRLPCTCCIAGLHNAARNAWARETTLILSLLICFSAPAFAGVGLAEVVYDSLAGLSTGGYGGNAVTAQRITLAGVSRKATSFEIGVRVVGDAVTDPNLQLSLRRPNGPGGRPGTEFWSTVSHSLIENPADAGAYNRGGRIVFSAPQVELPNSFYWVTSRLDIDAPILLPGTAAPTVGANGSIYVLDHSNISWIDTLDPSALGLRITAVVPEPSAIVAMTTAAIFIASGCRFRLARHLHA